MNDHQQHLKFKIAILSIALLIGQFFAIIHSVEHPYHEPTKSCQVYFALEQSGNGLISYGLVLAPPIFPSHFWVDFSRSPLLCSLTPYRIRAPPFSLVS